MRPKLLLNISVVLMSTFAAALCDYNNSPDCPTHHASCGIFDTKVGSYASPPLCHTSFDQCCQCIRSFWVCKRPNGSTYSGPDQDETAPHTVNDAHCSIEGVGGQCIKNAEP